MMIFICALFGFLGAVSLLGLYQALTARRWIEVEAQIVDARLVEFSSDGSYAHLMARVTYEFDGMSFENEIVLGTTGLPGKSDPSPVDSIGSRHLIRVNPKNPAVIASSNPPLWPSITGFLVSAAILWIVIVFHKKWGI